MDPRLSNLSSLCLKLPETTQKLWGDHAGFLVRKKIFVYFLANHHGDDIVSVCCRVMPGDNQALVASDPMHYYLPAYIAHRGWVAFRLDVGEPDWEVVGELVKMSYVLVAPRTVSQKLRESA